MSSAPPGHPSEKPAEPRAKPGVLDAIERIGNKLPEPPLLFVMLAMLVVVLSAIGSAAGWQVQPVKPQVKMVETVDATGQTVKVPEKRADGHPVVEIVPAGAPVEPRSLLDREGVYWMLSSMLRNFTNLPALGLIFVAMLGIGLAEKLGFFSGLMRALAFLTPKKLLTPVIVLLGASSSVASDAGYVVLPPLAAALFGAAGRHPLAGLAAAFAGVAGGFGAGFFPTGGDGALAGFAQDAAHVVDSDYVVNILHNLYFKAGSAIVVMFAGWWVTDRIVEPRLLALGAAHEERTAAAPSLALSPVEKRGLGWSLAANVAVLVTFGVLILVPGMPLHGLGQPVLADGRAILHHPITVHAADANVTVAAADVLTKEPLLVAEAAGRARLVESPGTRWSHVIVPIIFFAFLIPGLVYGRITGTLKGQKDLVEALYAGIRGIVPVLVIAFFMGQFVNYFAYTRLDRMLAYAGGSWLVGAQLPTELLLVLFVLLVVLGDFAISGMLSKFGVLAPIFIPMFMMVGISPELTTAAYRIGDSVVNIITPLNSYLLIILAVLQKYRANAGLGSLISLMLPYSLALGLAWTVFLLLWYVAGFDLGPESPLDYLPR
ncbi:AbgT family transporter [Myxococcota bacterium]|nr:AbgT family transporter [Myxococcota bacterium]